MKYISQHYQVELDGKVYSVKRYTDASVEIITQWEAFDISERNSVRQKTILRSRYVDPNGRLGRRVLAKAYGVQERPLRERLCTPMTVGQASIAASTVR